MVYTGSTDTTPLYIRIDLWSKLGLLTSPLCTPIDLWSTSCLLWRMVYSVTPPVFTSTCQCDVWSTDTSAVYIHRPVWHIVYVGPADAHLCTSTCQCDVESVWRIDAFPPPFPPFRRLHPLTSVSYGLLTPPVCNSQTSLTYGLLTPPLCTATDQCDVRYTDTSDEYIHRPVWCMVYAGSADDSLVRLKSDGGSQKAMKQATKGSGVGGWVGGGGGTNADNDVLLVALPLSNDRTASAVHAPSTRHGPLARLHFPPLSPAIEPRLAN